MRPDLRRATAEDLPAIARLLGEVFPSNPKADLDVLTWQYVDSPAGPASSWVWESAGRIVSHFTMLVVPATIDGRSTLVGKSADAATLPEFRGRGLFPGAVEASLDDLRRRGAAVAIFSPSNPTSRRSLETLGMVAVADPTPVLVRVSLRRARHGPTVPTAAEALRPDDVVLLEDAADGCHASVDRSSAWVHWRLANPSARYLVGRSMDGDRADGVAIGVVRPRGRLQALYVLDLAGRGRSSRRRALGDLVRRARATVTGPLVAVAISGTCPEQLYELTSSGLYRVSPRLSPGRFTFGMIALDNAGFDHTRRPWRLSWADLDHV